MRPGPVGEQPHAGATDGAAAAHAVDATEPENRAAVGRIFTCLDRLLGTRPGCREQGHRPEDIDARLMENAQALYSKGIDTPEKVEEWMTSSWHHDLKMAGALGITSNLGYEAGMTAVFEGLTAATAEGQPPLPKGVVDVLSNPALFGLCVGATVGVLDVGIGVVGGAAAKTRMYNGRCDHSEMPPSVPNPNPLQVHLKDVVTAAMLNVAKNSTRLLAPPIQNAIEGRPDGTISRLAADRIDIQIDGIGGFASNAIHQVLMLGPGEDYRSRLLLRGDLDKVIDKSQQTWGQASMDALKGAGQGALGLFSSTGPVAVVGTIAGFISALISSNASIDATSTRAHEQAANATIPPDRMHYQTALAKRASSTSMMGMMTAAIPGVVLPAVGLAVEGISAHVVDKLSARLAQWSAGGADGRTPRREVEEPEVVVLNERGLRVEDPTHTHF